MEKKLETIPAWQLNNVKSQREVILEAQRDKRKVHFATLMDICHITDEKLEPNFRKYKGQVVLRGDFVKDDSGAYAVFTEQGSSASQMTAAKVMDVIAKSPDCDGQAADAIPDSGKNGGRSQIAENSQSQNVQTKRYVFHDTSGRNHGQTWKIQWFLLNDICTAPHSLDKCGKDSFRKFCWNLDGKVPNWECLVVCRNQGLFLSVCVDGIKMAGKKHNMAPMWKKLMKTLILTNQLHFLITCIWDALTQRECKPNEIMIDEYILEFSILSENPSLGSYSRRHKHWTSFGSSYCENSLLSNTSYVVKSRETERIVNENHDHKEELRSSNELHTDLQRSERSELCEEERGTTAIKDACAPKSIKETCASPRSIPPTKVYLYKEPFL